MYNYRVGKIQCSRKYIHGTVHLPLFEELALPDWTCGLSVFYRAQEKMLKSKYECSILYNTHKK